MPRRRNMAQGMFPVHIIDEPEENKEGELLYEPILGEGGMTRNGVKLPIKVQADGSFAILSTTIPDVDMFVILTLQTPSTVIMCGEQRLGIITEEAEHFALWDAEAGKNKFRRIPKNDFPYHARLLIGCYLFWKYLVRCQLIEIEEPTH